MADEELSLEEKETRRNLRVLEEIEKNPSISQRDLSKRLGVALGIINSCIHTLARKGLIKIRGKNNRTLTYHLTHRGVLHKSRLAMKWTKNTINFYRRARQEIAGKLQTLANEGIKSIVLYGTDELAEIALIVASEANLEVLGIIADNQGDDQTRRSQILGHPVGNPKEILKSKPEAVITCTEISKEKISQLKKLSADGIKFLHYYAIT